MFEIKDTNKALIKYSSCPVINYVPYHCRGLINLRRIEI